MPSELSTTRPRGDWLVLIAALVFPSLVTLVYFVWLAGKSTAWQQLAYGVGKILQFGFPVFWVRFVQGRRLSIAPCRTGDLLEGGLLGGAILLGMALLHFAWLKTGGLPADVLQAIREKIAGLGVGTPARFLALGAFYALGHSLLEEYYWRWFAYRQWRERTSPRTATVVSALGFAAHHVLVLGEYFGWRSVQSLFYVAFFSASVAVGGVLWAWLYERRQSIYGVWLSHLLVDAGIFAVGYDLVLR